MTRHVKARPSAMVGPSDPTIPTTTTLPASGNVALASSAVVQAALGIEFTLSGLNKFADPAFVPNFTSFVSANPGATSGPLSGLVQNVVLPNAAVFATLLKAAEVTLGPILLVGALEVGRRRLSGRLGARHGYESALAVVAASAGVGAAGLAFSIFVLMGGVLPTVMPGRAFTSAIPVELLIVPLGLAVAWMELGRFLALRPRAAPPLTDPDRLGPKAAVATQ
ncbi:MAG: hypothetical protein QOI00_806 [Chloroflexota bacterium]|nr:hypothetical protein [Chloroflexota bacterium]MEA2606049.1 hypothetical protein [Chloroflexota bacterium]